MNASLQPGLSLRRRVTIDRAKTIDFLGERGRTYATPSFIMDIEQTCRELILECLLDYESGAMPPELRAELDRHYADCPPCGEFLVSYRVTGRTLQMLKPSEVPPALAKAVIAFVKARCKE